MCVWDRHHGDLVRERRAAPGRPRLPGVETHMGSLELVAGLDRPDLLASPGGAALASLDSRLPAGDVGVAEIDPELADTAEFCERYRIGLAESANCVVVTGRRGGETRFAACVVLATTRADVNGVVRRQLDVRKGRRSPRWRWRSPRPRWSTGA